MTTHDARSRPASDHGRRGPQGTAVIRSGELPESVRAARSAGSAASGDPVLVGLTPPFTEQRFRLDPIRTQIGRRGHNDIVLDHPSVSWEHAHVLHSGGRWWALNVLSTNGTYVNGTAIHEAEIGDGDRVTFGSATFEFRTRDSGEPARPPGGRRSRRRRLLLAAIAIAAGVALLVIAMR